MSLGKFHCEKTDPDLFIVSFLTGTTIEGFDLELTQYHSRYIAIPPLSVEAGIQILKEENFPAKTYVDPFAKQILTSMGIVPRLLEDVTNQKFDWNLLNRGQCDTTAQQTVFRTLILNWARRFVESFAASRFNNLIVSLSHNVLSFVLFSLHYRES